MPLLRNSATRPCLMQFGNGEVAVPHAFGNHAGDGGIFLPAKVEGCTAVSLAQACLDILDECVISSCVPADEQIPFAEDINGNDGKDENRNHQPSAFDDESPYAEFGCCRRGGCQYNQLLHVVF